jgi:uncharacterized protein (DUF2235 family)
VTFYLPGIGTKFTVKRAVTGRWTRFVRTDKVRQQIFGDNIEQIILRAYVNVCANFRLGDEIALIGFSRGAVAARIFSRLVSDFGILTAKNLLLLDSLWNEFVEISSIRTDVVYDEKRQKLKDELASAAGEPAFHTVPGFPIRFLGCFDTVMGAADEIWSDNVKFRDGFPATGVQHVAHLMSMHDARKDFELKQFDVPPVWDHQERAFRQMWMPGVHSDVGGGYTENFISSIALLTMAKMLEKYAGVVMHKESVVEVERAVKLKARAGQIHVNREPSVRERLSRIGLIGAHDGIHPLHYYLLDKNIHFKDSSNVTRYENRIGGIGVGDKDLAATFASWVHVPRRRASNK